MLAVDPTSPFTGGAILGDRVRMQRHIDDAGVYIRSMASRGHLGGISEATPRAVAVLDGMGFPEILIETVGVGQAEVEIAAATDTSVVVLNPGWGDSVQAAKAGLLEIGDIFVVNKADRAGVHDTIRDLKQMLELGGQRCLVAAGCCGRSDIRRGNRGAGRSHRRAPRPPRDNGGACQVAPPPSAGSSRILQSTVSCTSAWRRFGRTGPGSTFATRSRRARSTRGPRHAGWWVAKRRSTSLTSDRQCRERGRGEPGRILRRGGSGADHLESAPRECAQR